MVAGLNDKLIIGCTKRYIEDKKPVSWNQGFGKTSTTDFVFFPFHRADDPTDIGFVAVEQEKLALFAYHCRLVIESRFDYEEYKDEKTMNDQFRYLESKKFEFTVSDQFKYGQNRKKTFRFLVFQSPNCKLSQHRVISAFFQTKAADALGDPYKELLLSSINLDAMGNAKELVSFK